ncbi:hypothetical protein POM88_049740 [Heracleum sosnowskyi]|uniref:Uncharacterized protein n=1 Tax=Heracleum sosnowskyi TaxID=360622 RepID=A0AAD8GXI0_9APIA|nr:hypothetical protein POM88_049740 [Heracleum sosnowskyi]
MAYIYNLDARNFTKLIINLSIHDKAIVHENKTSTFRDLYSIPVIEITRKLWTPFFGGSPSQTRTTSHPLKALSLYFSAQSLKSITHLSTKDRVMPIIPPPKTQDKKKD